MRARILEIRGELFYLCRKREIGLEWPNHEIGRQMDGGSIPAHQQPARLYSSVVERVLRKDKVHGSIPCVGKLFVKLFFGKCACFCAATVLPGAQGWTAVDRAADRGGSG